MSTEANNEGGEAEVAAPPSAPPLYPVLGQPGQQYQQFQPQQPQQQLYANAQQAPQVIYAQPDESKQLDSDIATTFDTLIQLLNNKKISILNDCMTANKQQKKDISTQLQTLANNMNEIKINPNIKPLQAPPQQIVIVQPQPKQNIKYITDTWNTMVSHHHLVFNKQTNSVCRTGKRGEWLNSYGNQVIRKGQYKKWEIKIVPKFEPKHKKDFVADVVIGVVNAKKTSDRAGGFWLGPALGYGYYGYSGKKFHSSKKGSNYSDKFSVNDTISIEINMKEFELGFYVNGEFKGKAFPIDARIEYVFAASLCSPDYDLQIC